MPTIDLPQGTVHYRETGPSDAAGPTVVFAHGFLVNGELWYGVMDRLADLGVRSIAPDLPLGSHPIALHPGTDLSPRGIARLMLDLLAALELTDVTLAGNDTGGALCQFLIDTDASRIGRLVLTNCDAFDTFPPRPFDLVAKLARRPGVLHAMMTPMRSTALRHSALGFGLLVNRPLDPAMTRRFVEPSFDPDIRRDTAAFMARIDPRELLDVSTRLGAFDKPVRLVWGDADPFFRLPLAQRLERAFPQAALRTVSGGRAFLPLDEPDLVAGEIAAVTVS